jgi:hypothetical protein
MNPGIMIIIAAFVVAVLGLFASNLAQAGNRGLLSLSRLDTAILVVSAFGFIAGIWKELADSREGVLAKGRSRQLQIQITENGNDLRVIKAKLDGLAGHPGLTPTVAQDLRALSDNISAVASSARSADLRMSDFSRSHFGEGNFTEASFEHALIDRAWLKDAVITNSNLDGANFDGSRFVGAKFAGAFFDGADFRGADLSRVLADPNTKFPK